MSKTYFVLNPVTQQIRAVQYEETLGEQMVNNKNVFKTYEMANRYRDYSDCELHFNF